MNESSIRSIAIVGGDIAGWTAAAGLANSLKGLDVSITVLELPDLINVEPVQYTTPGTLAFFEHLGIDATELVRQTGATYRLGTGLHDVSAKGDHRISAFGPHGAMMGFVHFNHFIARAKSGGQDLHLNDYSPTAVAARNAKFCISDDRAAPPIHFGLNLNTEKLTQLLSRNATLNGVRTARSRVDGVRISGDGRRIETLLLDDGSQLQADFYIDCSGEDGLLTGATLGVEYVDWSHWLPCSKAIGVTAKTPHDNIPVHHCTATDNGWLLSTPLQYRTACRFLYCPEDVGDEAAATEVRDYLGVDEAEALAMNDVRSGHRAAPWHLNCVALGAAAGYVEPLDLSTLHFIQSAVLRLAQLWPASVFQPELAAEYNRAVINEFECVRDFTMLRYIGATWRSTPFWKRVASSDRPDSLENRIELFRSRGRVHLDEHETFDRDAWVGAFLAAELWPAGYDPLLDSLDAQQLQQHFTRMKVTIAQAVQAMPGHRDFISKQLA